MFFPYYCPAPLFYNPLPLLITYTSIFLNRRPPRFPSSLLPLATNPFRTQVQQPRILNPSSFPFKIPNNFSIRPPSLEKTILGTYETSKHVKHYTTCHGRPCIANLKSHVISHLATLLKRCVKRSQHHTAQPERNTMDHMSYILVF